MIKRKGRYPLPVVYFVHCNVCGETKLADKPRKTKLCADCKKALEDTWITRKNRLHKLLGGKCQFCSETDDRALVIYHPDANFSAYFLVEEVLALNPILICQNCICKHQKTSRGRFYQSRPYI